MNAGDHIACLRFRYSFYDFLSFRYKKDGTVCCQQTLIRYLHPKVRGHALMLMKFSQWGVGKKRQITPIQYKSFSLTVTLVTIYKFVRGRNNIRFIKLLVARDPDFSATLGFADERPEKSKQYPCFLIRCTC